MRRTVVLLSAMLAQRCDARSWQETKSHLPPPLCPILSTRIPWGSVTVTGRESGATATYSCDATHELLGSSTRTCEMGAWSGDEPSCRVRYSTKMDNSYKHGHAGYKIGEL